ncbi:uncharacterized protein LOC107046833 [Diachasma alloeum]|uniref:uncharacterized protein LOC107046833 n=1 Tax=Diachasma alloeum TaxID=454923 RepID=UPI00073815D1|nr:uncharacterized protein LOC107046833 [Diachasma alloeum]
MLSFPQCPRLKNMGLLVIAVEEGTQGGENHSSKTRGTQRKTVTPARRRKGKATGQTINTPPNPQQNIFDRDFPPFVVEEIGQGDCEDDEPEFTDFEVLEDEDGLMELGLRECDLLDGAEHAFL